MWGSKWISSSDNFDLIHCSLLLVLIIEYEFLTLNYGWNVSRLHTILSQQDVRAIVQIPVDPISDKLVGHFTEDDQLTVHLAYRYHASTDWNFFFFIHMFNMLVFLLETFESYFGSLMSLLNLNILCGGVYLMPCL